MPLTYSKPLRSPIIGALLISICLVSAQSHAVWHWMRGAALTDFSDSDWEILSETAREVLDNRPDGEQVNWSNPETGNRGSIIALATFSHEGQRCRRAAMRNLTFRGRDDKAAYSLCRQADGEWSFVAESTLMADGGQAPAADNEPAADEAPAADSEPAADIETATDQKISAEQETVTP